MGHTSLNCGVWAHMAGCRLNRLKCLQLSARRLQNRLPPYHKYKSSLASGASPQTPPGGLFLPPGPPPPAWVHAAHRHGMVSPRKVWFQRPCSSLVLVPEEVVEPASGRYVCCSTSVSLGIWSLGTSATAAFMHIPHASYTHICVATCHTAAFALRPSSQMARCCRNCFLKGMSTEAEFLQLLSAAFQCMP